MDGPRPTGTQTVITFVPDAVRLLEEDDDGVDAVPIRHLTVVFHAGVGRDADAVSFGRLVTLLGQQREEGGRRTVPSIDFKMDWRRLPSDDVLRLFRDVIPGHPMYESIGIDIDQLPVRCLKCLTDSVPSDNGASPLTRVHFNGDPNREVFDEEKFQAIVDMLNRKVALATLYIEPLLDAHQGKRLCQTVLRNPHHHLRNLSLRVKDVYADTLDGVATLPLQRLMIMGSYSKDAVSHLARQLRTNETLEYVRVEAARTGRRDSQSLLELVKTYNWTITVIGGNLGSQHFQARIRQQFEPFRKRNARIRDALQELQHCDPDKRFVVPTELLPPVLGLVSDVPTVLFRVLKLGGGMTISDHIRDLQEAAAAFATGSTTTASAAGASTTVEDSTKPRRRPRSPPSVKRRRVLAEEEEEAKTM